MNFTNALFARATPGNPIVLGRGFMFASFAPENGSTYTVTNSLPGDIAPATKVSPVLAATLSLPNIQELNPNGYHTHTITCVSGTAIDIMYVTGL